MATLHALLDRVERRAAERSQQRRPMSQYAGDPCAYAREVLGVTWWAKQEEIARLLCTPPYKVLVKASHAVGKTFLAAGLVNWWYDAYDPSIALTTAPTVRQVRDLLWKEIRLQRGRRAGFTGPKMPRLESAPDHFAHGFTARDGESFQGHHGDHILIVFDEAVGVEPVFWETAQSMFAGAGHAWLAIFNPTDISSQAYIEERTGQWHVVSLSALEHPNILAESAGQLPPYPAAIRLERLDALIRQWCTPVSTADRRIGDVEWPLASGSWWRPGPVAESRLLGRWPSQAVNSVWSEAVWDAAEKRALPEPQKVPPEIGCDVARFGDDMTAMHVRRGPVSLHHEAHNGWSTGQTAGRLRVLAEEYGCRAGMDPKRVLVKVDDDGVGGGVTDQANGFAFVPVSAASKPLDEEGYPNKRSELWFAVAELAGTGLFSLAALPASIRSELRRQALAPTYKLDSRGRRVVEPKDETKKRLGRSPDDMDAINLAYAFVGSGMERLSGRVA
jgi:hypothetical protein